MARSSKRFWPERGVFRQYFHHKGDLMDAQHLRRAVTIMAVFMAPLWRYSGDAAAADEARPITVCLMSGSLEYKSNESLVDFQKFVEERYPARCLRAFMQGKDESHLDGLDNLDRCDVMLLFTRRLKIDGD